MTPIEEANPLCRNTHSFVIDLLKKYKPDVCFDIGAHVGGYLPMVLDSYPDTTIHAFEPVPKWYKKMEEQFGRDPRIVMNRMAISDRCYTMRDMQLYNGWTIARAEDKVALDFCPGENEKFDVAAVTLDEYCSRAKVQPGFMKVDVDGYEQKFNNGAAKVLRDMHPFMMLELSSLMAKIGDPVEPWVQELLNLGYRFCAMDGSLQLTDYSKIIEYYPYHTSFDVVLLHSSHSL